MSELSSKVKSKEAADSRAFGDLFPVLVDDLTEYGMKHPQIGDAVAYFKKVSEHNVPHGKRNRGLMVATAYRYLLGDEASQEELRNARVIGWCIEWLQACLLVADDIMDCSHTRRGRTCWHKYRPVVENKGKTLDSLPFFLQDEKGVGLTAINDSYYLEQAVYVLLKKYIKAKPYYVNILELFHESTLNTVIGQCLDMGYSDHSWYLPCTNHTLDKHTAISTWKTGYYSFYLPVAAALYMAGIADEKTHNNAKTILLEMGVFFQIQDDYLDVFGDPKVTGKIGTDIEDNKCTWLVVQALQRATPEQKTGLQANFGKNDPDKVAAVKQIYKEIGMEQVYAEHEEKSYKELTQMIEELRGELPAELFTHYADKIYKRKK